MYHTTTHIYLGHKTLNNKFVTGFIGGKITILWQKRLQYKRIFHLPKPDSCLRSFIIYEACICWEYRV